MPGEVEAALTKALEEWRNKAAKEWLSEGNIRLHGLGLLMPDDVLEDIVKYASKRKLLTAESLQVHARWRRWERFGAQVLQVVNSFIPQTHDGTVRPLANSTAQFINFGVESVSFSIVKADCMISSTALRQHFSFTFHYQRMSLVEEIMQSTLHRFNILLI